MRYLHTMVRVSNLEQSLDFYCNKLGLKEVRRVNHEAGRFTLVFVAAPGQEDCTIELTHNWDPEQYTGGRNFGHVAYEEDQSRFLMTPGFQKNREYSEETAREIDIAVRDIVKAAYDKAIGILSREKKILEKWAGRLLEKETLVEAELDELRRGLAAVAPAR